MTQLFTQLAADAGPENALGVSLYIVAVVAFALAIVVQVSWKAIRRVIRHRRVARELRLVHEAAYRERAQRGSYVA